MQGMKTAMLAAGFLACSFTVPGQTALKLVGYPSGSVPIDSISWNLQAEGGTPPYAFSLTPGAAVVPGFAVHTRPAVPSWLPADITAVYMGVGRLPGTYSTSLRVTDSAGTTFDQAVTFKISPIDILPIRLENASIGDSFSAAFSCVDAAGACTLAPAGTLPPGLTFDPGTKILSGSFASAGSFNFHVTATDAAGNTVARYYSLHVSAMRFGAGVPANRYLMATAGIPVNLSLAVTGGTGPYNWSLPQEPLPPGFTLNAQTGAISGSSTNVYYGYGFTVRVTDGGGNTLERRFGFANLPNTVQALRFTSTGPIQDITLGSGISNGLYAAGGLPPYTATVAPGSSLPPGLSLIAGGAAFPSFDPHAVYLYGRVRTEGSYSFSLILRDSVGNTSQAAFSVGVTPLAMFDLSLPAGSEPPIMVNQPYSRQMVVVGGTPPYQWTPDAALPAGLTLSSGGVLSGTPLTTHFNDFYMTVKDADERSMRRWSRVNVVSGTPVTLRFDSGADLGLIATGQAYNLSLPISFSPAPSASYNFQVVQGSLPPGVRLVSGATLTNVQAPAALSGTFTAAGNYRFVIRATDNLGNMGQKEFNLRITPLQILNTSLPPGGLGVPYNSRIEAVGGTLPLTFSLVNSTLPSGLTLNANTGEITGTPSAPTNQPFTIQAMDANGNSLNRSFLITISSLWLTNQSALPNATYGAPYSHQFNLTGTCASCQWTVAGGLPSGLSLSQSGLLSGTPATTGLWTFSVQAGNGSTSVTRLFALYIAPPAASQMSPVIVTSGPVYYIKDQLASILLWTDTGVSPFTWSIASGVLPPGLAIVPSDRYLNDFGGNYRIYGRVTTPGVYTFMLRATDATGKSSLRTMTIAVSQTGVGNPSIRPALVGQYYAMQLVAVQGGSFSIVDRPNASLPPGLTLSSGGYISGVPTSTGRYTYYVKVDNGGTPRIQTLTMDVFGVSTPVNRRIDFGPTGHSTLTDASAGHNYTSSLSPSGFSGNVTWTLLSSLPPGLSLLSGATLPPGFSPTMAYLAGVPTTPGTYAIRVRAVDDSGNVGERELLLNVSKMRLSPPNNSMTLSHVIPPAQSGKPYSHRIQVSNGNEPLVYTLNPETPLPAGLSLAADGTIGGTPGETGYFTLDLTIADAANARIRQILSFDVAGDGVFPPALLNFSALPEGSTGESYSFELERLLRPGTGKAPFSWSLRSGSLPQGMQIVPGAGSGSAVLAGSPVAPGSYSLDLNVQDAQGTSNLQGNVTVNVSSLAVSPASEVLPPGSVGVAYSQTLTPAGGTGNYTFKPSLNSSMPVGLTLSASGVLSGTPTTAGDFRLFIEVQDEGGHILTKRYQLSIAPSGTLLKSLKVLPETITFNWTPGNPAPLPITFAVSGPAGPLDYSVAATGGAWLSVSPTSGATPGTFQAQINTAGLVQSTYSGAIRVSSNDALNSPFVVPVTLTVGQQPCYYSVNPPPIRPAGGGIFDLWVSTNPGCAWTASSPEPWISVSTANGAGSAPVRLTLAPNGSGTERTGVVSVAGYNVPVRQAGAGCSFSLSSYSTNLWQQGGETWLALYTSGGSCPWTIQSNVPWIQVVSPIGGGSSSTSVRLSVQANGGVNRTGTVQVANQVFTVNQAGSSCSISLSPNSVNATADGGELTLNATATQGCSWDAVSPVNWITVVSGSPTTGSGQLKLSVAANTSSQPRLAYINVGSSSIYVNQAGTACSLTVSSDNPIMPAAGGTGSVAVLASSPGCTWGAGSSSSWLKVSQASGTGNGSITYTVDQNFAGSTRIAQLSVAGQGLTVRQGGTSCEYVLSSNTAVAPPLGGPGAVNLSTAPGCSWTAMSSVTWLYPTTYGNGSGSALVTFQVMANQSGQERAALLTVGNQTLTVIQKAPSCAIVSLSSQSAGFPELGGSTLFTYRTAVAGCRPGVSSSASWISITDSSYSGDTGTVSYTVQPNGGLGRSSSIRIGDSAQHSVSQAASTCTYTLTSNSTVSDRFGGPKQFGIASTSGACAPGSFVLPPTGILTLDAITGAAPNFIQNFTVLPFQSFSPYIRTAEINVRGNIHVVKQNSW